MTPRGMLNGRQRETSAERRTRVAAEKIAAHENQITEERERRKQEAPERTKAYKPALMQRLANIETIVEELCEVIEAAEVLDTRLLGDRLRTAEVELEVAARGAADQAGLIAL